MSVTSSDSKKSKTSMSIRSVDTNTDLSVTGKTRTSGGPRYRWTSHEEYFSNTVFYSLTLRDILRITDIKRQDCNILHYLIVIVLVGMPLLYMQVSIGQYTQLSGTYLRNMCPIGAGIGYLFVVSNMFSIITISVFAGDCLLYLCSTLLNSLPWLTCKELYKDVCWPSKVCTGTCINATVQTSAHIYYNKSFLGMDFDTVKSFPDPRRSVAAIFIWIMIYIMLVNSTSISKKSVKYVCHVGLSLYMFVTVLIIIYTPEALGMSLKQSFSFRWKFFISPSVWVKSIRQAIIFLGIPRGGHILLGSYLETNAPSGILTLFSTLTLIFITYALSIFVIMCMTVVQINCNMTVGKSVKLKHLFTRFTLTIIPYSFGFCCIAELITILYFIGSILLCIAYITTNLKILQISIEDDHPRLIRYRKYIRFTFLITCLLLSFSFLTKELHAYTNLSYIGYIFDGFDICTSFLFSLLVCWFYGVQRLCDDLHFNLGSQPSKFWKICWYLAPASLGFCYIWSMIIIFYKKHGNYKVIIIHVLILPTLIIGIIEVFRYLKLRNLIGLFKPRDRWGPPNLEERLMRHTFNPRMEIRSRRRNETCLHKCLLDSKVLQNIIQNERMFQDELEMNSLS